MSSSSLHRFLAFVLLLLASAVAGHAQTKPFVHPLFSSNMILQRDALDPIWGWTTPGASVTVSINGQVKSATADGAGRWQVQVGPFPVGGPYTMQVSGPQSVTFSNILLGDVILVSGQSNIDRPVAYSYNASADQVDSENYPNIRVFTVVRTAANTPQETIPSAVWQVPHNSVTNNFSATAYYTARELYKQKGIPLGMLVSSWGATQIHSWVDAGVSSSLADYTQALYDQTSTVATQDGASTIYNAMIAPLAPFRFSAVIWYQGESNTGRGQQYGRLLAGLMSGWRSLYGQPNLPFLIVQLPNNEAAQTTPVETNKFMEIREAQLNAVLNDSGRSRLVTTIDIGEGVLHPLNKQDVGLRLSWAIRNLLYGDNIVSQGPILTNATRSGSAMLCTFSNVGSGLMAGSKNAATPLSPVSQVAGTAVKGFALAGADHVFYFADATITGANTLSVTSSSVSAPVYIRYAWANNPVCNLYAKITDSNGTVTNGLPAGSMRNDPVYKLNTNASTGGIETYVAGAQRTVVATVPSGEVFHHWGGDTATLSGSGSSVTSTLSQIYVSLRAYFQIVAAPSVTVSAQVGQNVVEWTPLTSVHYNVKRGPSSTGPFTTIAGNLLNVTRYEDRESTDGGTYYYTVSAVNEVGEGPNAPPASVTTIPYVRTLSATAGNAQVALSWSAFSGGALSYTIYRSTTAGGPYQVLVRGLTALNYTDHAVISGASYSYVAAAETAGGSTPVSPEASARPNFLPPPMNDQDVGPVSLPGSVTVSGPGQFTIKASGADISGSPDQFHFAYVPITGNCTVAVRVASIDSTNTFAKGGVMLRESLASDCSYAFCYFRGNQANSGVQFRTTNGGTYSNTDGGPANRWVRVTRAGNVFTTATSSDGSTWVQTGTAQTIAMPATIYAGLALTSHDNTKLNTTVFDNVTGLGLQPAQAPQNLSAGLRPADAGVDLRWEASPGALGYKVKRAAASGGPYVVVADTINATRYVASGLTAGRRYYFVVTAVTGVGESASSNQVAVETPAVAAGTPIPIGLSAIPGNGQVTLGWDGSSVATSFNVKRGTSIDGPFTTIGSPATPGYTDPGLITGTTYYYVVSALGSAGESANTAPVAATPGYPATAGAIRAEVNSLYVSAVGTNPMIANKQVIGSTELYELLDLGSGQTAIRSLSSGLYVSATSSGTGRLAASASSIGTWERFVFTYTGTTFNFKAMGNNSYVSADGAGSSPLIANRASAGGYETFSFLPLPVPTVPVGVIAAPADSNVALAWNPVGGATSYIVKRSLTSAGTYVQIGTTTGTSFKDPAANNGVAYYYTVSSANGSLISGNSGVVSAVPAVPPPAPPAGLSAQAVSETQVVLGWTDQANNASAYVVERSPAGLESWATLANALPAGAESFRDDTAAASSSYDYRVRATGAGGASGNIMASVTLPAGIGDGIPGAWRYRYFGNGLTLTPASEQSADPDGDGMDNAAEFQSGTNPSDPASALRILSIVPSAVEVAITFSTASGQSYAVEKTASLVAPATWTTVQDAIPGTGGSVQAVDHSTPSDQMRFYRVRVK